MHAYVYIYIIIYVFIFITSTYTYILLSFVYICMCIEKLKFTFPRATKEVALRARPKSPSFATIRSRVVSSSGLTGSRGVWGVQGLGFRAFRA